MPKKHPEHQMVSSCLQQRALEQDKSSHTGDGKKEAEMGIDRSYTTHPAANITRQDLDWNQQKKRKVYLSRPGIEAEAKVAGMT